jgi:hypothetical protein
MRHPNALNNYANPSLDPKVSTGPLYTHSYKKCLRELPKLRLQPSKIYMFDAASPANPANSASPASHLLTGWPGGRRQGPKPLSIRPRPEGEQGVTELDAYSGFLKTQGPAVSAGPSQK